ncbi:enolase-phosphatase E1 isoform X2 [Cryptotermes secundus]|nr:enolase-phosphatase E1 isoform X2 [Cryptotermes secundus]
MEAVAKNVLWQMDLDRKTKALKQLQGHIMREGYKNGNLKGHVYSDVVPALKSWAHSGRRIYVYSSGSVEAQKLLFGHSEEGDLLDLFAGHFDTEVGPKVEPDSYVNIVKKLDCRSEDIVFLTDVPREAEAAQKAGLKAVIVVREGTELLTEEDKVSFPVIKSFHDFVFEASAKRKKMCTNDESPANGPISETSESSITEKNKAVKKTEEVSPESAGSGNTVSSSDCEMMDVSSNDAQVTDMEPDKTKIESQSTDDKTMAVEDSDTKESEKVELEPDDSEVCKTESSAPESKTVGAPDVEKESPKVCSENAEECDGKEVSVTSLTKLSAEVSKVDIDVKLNDSKADKKDSEAGETEVDIKGIPANEEETKVDAEETEAVGMSTKDKNVEVRISENDSRDGAELETVSGGSKNKSVGTISNCLESESGALETGSEEGKIDSCDEVAEVNAGDKKKFCDSRSASGDVKGDSCNEDANLEETEADTQNKKTDVNNTETEEKMETNTTEIENVKGINDEDVKDTEKNDRDTLAAEMEDEITEEMESSAKLGKNDVALKKKIDMESGGTANGREKGENTKPSEDLSVSEESGVTKSESEVATKTESDILNQTSEKQSDIDFSADASPENTDASPEESKTEGISEDPESTDKMLQDKMEDVSDAVKNEDSELLATSDNDTVKEDANANEDTKPLDSKNEGDEESKTAEDTAKENGLAFTTENGKGDVTNKCPDTEQNGEVTDKEQDVKIKKLSIDGSGNTSMTKDDVATPAVASGSS